MVSDKVLVSAYASGPDSAEPVWQRVLDRDSEYFQRFRDVMQVDLDAGRSITITPLSDLEALALAEPPDGAVSSVSWAPRSIVRCGGMGHKE